MEYTVDVNTFSRCHYHQRAASPMKWIYPRKKDVSTSDSIESLGQLSVAHFCYLCCTLLVV